MTKEDKLEEMLKGILVGKPGVSLGGDDGTPYTEGSVLDIIGNSANLFRMTTHAMQVVATNLIPNADVLRLAPPEAIAAAFMSGMCAGAINTLRCAHAPIEHEIGSNMQMLFPEATALSLECQGITNTVKTALPDVSSTIEEAEKRCNKWRGKSES